jgi:dTDP-4-dehydrorhamnose reductase
MKILLIGGGYISTVLQNCFRADNHTVAVADFPDVDITKRTSVEHLITTELPDVIINAAAFTDTNAAELPENQDKVYEINVHGPANIASVAQARGIPWIQFSTAMMFDGSTGANGWTEHDTPHPTNYYSWTKAWADAELAPWAEKPPVYILRIHTPLASLSHDRNFMNRLQKFDKAIDIPTSVTVVEDLYHVITTLLEKNAPGGIYHAVNGGTISAFRIAELMQEGGLIPAEKTLTPLTREELDAMTKEKGGAHQTFPILDTLKLQDLGIVFPDAEMAVRRTIQNFHEA